MTSMNYCRLCVNIGLDFKSLYDEDGQGNEVYELTTKYFDPPILNIEEDKHLTVICLQCWEHIWDFNNFQQAVHVAQSNLHAVRQLDIATPIPNAETNVTKDTVHDLEHNNSSTADEKKEEIEAPIVTQPALNIIESLEKNDEDLTKVDLTLDEDVAPSNMDADELAVEFEDPIGAFIGGEFTNENEITPQPDLVLINIDSDSNLSFKSTETLSACETDINNVDQDSYNTVGNVTQGGEQYSSNNNLIQEAFNEEFNKFLSQSMQSLKCAICSESCYRYYILREHFNQKHPSENIQTLCCNNKYTGLQDISAHLMSHNGPMTLTCEWCGKTYVIFHHLKRHIIKHHPGEGIQLWNIREKLLYKDYEKNLQQRSRNIYPCNECGKGTTSFFSLRRHMWLYHQAKHKFKCVICERTFKTAQDLREHMISYTGEHQKSKHGDQSAQAPK